MDSINWLHLRGLALLALLGLYFTYALLVATWPTWRRKLRARRSAELRASRLTRTESGRSEDGHVTSPRAWHDVKPAVDLTRHAA